MIFSRNDLSTKNWPKIGSRISVSKPKQAETETKVPRYRPVTNTKKIRIKLLNDNNSHYLNYDSRYNLLDILYNG